MSKPTATYDAQLNRVTVELPRGGTLTPNQAYQLYLALSELLYELPQPLSRHLP